MSQKRRLRAKFKQQNWTCDSCCRLQSTPKNDSPKSQVYHCLSLHLLFYFWAAIVGSNIVHIIHICIYIQIIWHILYIIEYIQTSLNTHTQTHIDRYICICGDPRLWQHFHAPQRSGNITRGEQAGDFGCPGNSHTLHNGTHFICVYYVCIYVSDTGIYIYTQFDICIYDNDMYSFMCVYIYIRSVCWIQTTYKLGCASKQGAWHHPKPCLQVCMEMSFCHFLPFARSMFQNIFSLH